LPGKFLFSTEELNIEKEGRERDSDDEEDEDTELQIHKVP
jgi:hypothetical protein